MAGKVVLDEREVEFGMIRAQGAGGQNVNKVSCAVHLRFDIGKSSLPEVVKAALLALNDQRVSSSGVVVIKAQGSRSLKLNQLEALQRLQELVDRACQVEKPRKATKPTRGSQQRRLKGKAVRSDVKRLRGKPTE
ncbi:alternative ribosome rescue aminoacyl-tRNA hydrolase ArfB [Neisseriaceae bacterium JH1-16]|nr:alternative ribosome rescue aminoacyl-tRNA hydrolase ArfB [Neisseriaceae bacterium JH1-16]